MSADRRYGKDDSGYCFCPKCDYHVIHRKGIPCQKERCPKCGTKMILKMGGLNAEDKRSRKNFKHND